MDTEKTRDNSLQQMEQNKPDELHLKTVGEEQERVKELLRRGAIRHYFLGPENIWTREGFGIVIGGVLAVFFGGIIFPKIFLYSSNSEILNKFSWAMTAVGVILLGKGLFEMLKEFRMKSEPVSDEVYDEILEHDVENLKAISKELLEENIPRLKEEGNLEAMEMLLVKGPRDYTANVNLPLLWRLGGDGKLRYSNFSVMALYFGEEVLYIYTCIFNMRNSTAKFPHTYECPYTQIRSAGFEDRTIETVNQNNKSVSQHLKVLVIKAGESEDETLSLPVADYDVMKKYNGVIDIRDAEKAVKILREKMKL